jgi:hypothetical protein
MYTEKLESLSKEYAATMEHANEVLKEIVETTLLQELVNAYDVMNPIEKILFTQSIVDGSFFEIFESKLRDECETDRETDSEKTREENHSDDISGYIRLLEVLLN